MPGATLVEVVDDGTWKTTMAVKLGPVGMDFLNDVRIVEQDDAGRHRCGSSRHAAATSAAGAAPTPRSTRACSRATEAARAVTLDTDVRFSGQAAQLGRPAVIQDVSRASLDAVLGVPTHPAQSRSSPREEGSP